MRLFVMSERSYSENVDMYHVRCWKRNGFSNKMALVSHVIDFVDVTVARCRMFSVYISIHIVVESACLVVRWF
jgi:hypothetical protein